MLLNLLKLLALALVLEFKYFRFGKPFDQLSERF